MFFAICFQKNYYRSILTSNDTVINFIVYFMWFKNHTPPNWIPFRNVDWSLRDGEKALKLTS